MSEKIATYGSTGDPEKDGILSPEQQELLNKIQAEAADALFNHLENMQEGDSFPLAAMATGIGKTRIEHLIIEKEKRRNPNAKIFFAAGTKVALVDQSSHSLKTYQEVSLINNPDNNYIEAEDLDDVDDDISEIVKEEEKTLKLYRVGKFGAKKDFDVHISTAQGMVSSHNSGRLNPEDFTLVADEVHNMGTNKRNGVVSKFKRAYGLSATPHRSSGHRRSPEDYGFEVVYQLSLPEAQEKELLPPLVGIQINTSQLVEEIPTRLNGTIDYKKLEQILKDSPDLRPYIVDRVSEIIKKDGKEYKTVVATNFVWEAQEIARLFKEKGISVGIAVNKKDAKVIDSPEIPALDSIDRYKLSQDHPDSIQVLVSPYVASEGFDAPFTEALVWASPTDSDLRYTQYTGRLARRAQGKAFGIIIDCLYQTSQFKWNYNFGMWMKGEVRQLEGGLLYLGPEKNVKGISGLDSVKTINTQIRPIDRIKLSDLEDEGLEDVMDTDFAITQVNLHSVFIGNDRTLRPLANVVIAELQEEQPELIVRRRRGNLAVTAVTDGELFIERMLGKGAKLKEELEYVQDTDFAVTLSNLKSFFSGEQNLLYSTAKSVLEEIRSENPEMIERRRSGNTSVEIVKDQQLFLQKMQNKGIGLRDKSIQEIQDTDFAISQPNLISVFRGQAETIRVAANGILEEIRSENPEMIVRRMNGTHTIEVVTNGTFFIGKMLEIGMKLKNESMEEVKDTDFAVTRSSIESFFVGSKRLRSATNESLEEIRREYPELIVERKNGTRQITAVTDRDFFIQKMVEKGSKIRE